MRDLVDCVVLLTVLILLLSILAALPLIELYHHMPLSLRPPLLLLRLFSSENWEGRIYLIWCRHSLTDEVYAEVLGPMSAHTNAD